MDHTSRIGGIIGPTLDGMGYELVRVQMLGTQRRTLQVMAERRDRRPMTVEDCADISRAVSAVLDVADPIRGAYTLEVSSPGIDRPLVRPEDFERFAGFEAKVETSRIVGGRRRFRGRLVGLTPTGDVRMTTDDGEDLDLPFAEIDKAKLVLTDDLIAAALAEQDLAEREVDEQELDGADDAYDGERPAERHHEPKH